MSHTIEYRYRKKLISLPELLKVVQKLKSVDKKVVFTNGCFDILHKGHIHYLRKSRMMGDVLIVGLNSDSSVRRLKGAGRPINSEQDRACLLEALDFVDYIVIFHDDTPISLIQQMKPDFYTKSGDYDVRNIIGPGLGSDIIEAYGGRAIIMEYVKGYSTTSLIKNYQVGKEIICNESGRN